MIGLTNVNVSDAHKLANALALKADTGAALVNNSFIVAPSPNPSGLSMVGSIRAPSMYQL